MAFCKNCGNQIEDNAATCPSCRNWSIGQCHHWNFVVHSGRCDRSRHCQHGILRSYEKLDLQMASYYIWLSLQE